MEAQSLIPDVAAGHSTGQWSHDHSDAGGGSHYTRKEWRVIIGHVVRHRGSGGGTDIKK